MAVINGYRGVRVLRRAKSGIPMVYDLFGNSMPTRKGSNPAKGGLL